MSQEEFQDFVRSPGVAVAGIDGAGGPRREIPNHIVVLGLRFEETAPPVTPSLSLPPPPSSHICLCTPRAHVVIVVIIIVAIIIVTILNNIAVFITTTTSLIIITIKISPISRISGSPRPHILRGHVGSSTDGPSGRVHMPPSSPCRLTSHTLRSPTGSSTEGPAGKVHMPPPSPLR